MGSKSRRKGAQYERDIVNAAKAKGMSAERIQGRAGAARLGDPDVLIADVVRVECKRRAKLPDYLMEWGDGADAVVMRDDGRKSVVVMPLDRWLALVKWATEQGWPVADDDANA
jgi:hypothetical protein